MTTESNAPTAEELARKLARAIVELSGGEFTWNLADRHFGDGESLRRLVEVVGLDERGRRLTRSTLQRRIQHAWAIAEEYGVLPDNWHRQPPGNPRIKLCTTGEDLFEPGVGKRHNKKAMVSQPDGTLGGS